MRSSCAFTDRDSDWLIWICWPHVHNIRWFVRYVLTLWFLCFFLAFFFLYLFLHSPYLSLISSPLSLLSRSAEAGMHQLWAVLQCQGTVNRDAPNELPAGRQQRGLKSGKTADFACALSLGGLDNDFLSVTRERGWIWDFTSWGWQWAGRGSKSGLEMRHCMLDSLCCFFLKCSCSFHATLSISFYASLLL